MNPPVKSVSSNWTVCAFCGVRWGGVVGVGGMGVRVGGTLVGVAVGGTSVGVGVAVGGTSVGVGVGVGGVVGAGVGAGVRNSTVSENGESPLGFVARTR